MRFKVQSKMFRRDRRFTKRIRYNEFQTVELATEKARVPNVRCYETAEYSVCDGWMNGDFGGRKLQTLTCSTRRGTLELGTKDNDEQPRQACTAPTVE